MRISLVKASASTRPVIWRAFDDDARAACRVRQRVTGSRFPNSQEPRVTGGSGYPSQVVRG
jgi:hypothetical protein